MGKRSYQHIEQFRMDVSLLHNRSLLKVEPSMAA